MERKCGKSGCPNIGDKKCSRCKDQFYCSKDCQKADWKTHKKICNMKEQGTKKKDEENEKRNETSYSFESMLLNFVKKGILGVSSSFADEYMQAFPNDTHHRSIIEKFEIMYRFNMKSKETFNRLNHEDFTAHQNFYIRWSNSVLDGDRLMSFISGRPKFGDIYVRKSYPPCSIPCYQTMRNTSIADQVYEFARTYVGFGYVDLFQLVWGHFKKSTTETLTFYGWDMNRVTVLRSKLIYFIFKYFEESEINTISALQVWFSSCWDAVTSKAFDYLIKNLLSNTQKYNLCNEEVAILKLWRTTKINTHEAKHKFNNQSQSSEFDDVWRMKTTKDRVMFLRYIFTGCIFADEDNTVCGNPTMFTSYQGKTKQSKEFFFNGVDLLARGVKQEAHGENKSDSLFDTLTSATLQAVLKFRGLVKTEKIVCNLQTKFIDTSNIEFAAEIRALNPFGIDWSNTPDYMEKKSFIKFARACSVEDTVHYVHFLNWDQYVFGSCHVDWSNDQEKCNKMYKKFVQNRIDNALREEGGLADFFTGPAYTNTLNGVNLMLSTKFRQTFEDFFLSDENGKVLNRIKTSVCDTLVSSFFCQSPTMFRSVFTFNDDIELDGANNGNMATTSRMLYLTGDMAVEQKN